MAAPKALKSPASAGNPKNVSSPVPNFSEQELKDLEAIEKFSPEEEADLAAIERFVPESMPLGGAMQRERLSREEIQAITPSSETIKGMVSEFAGGATAAGGGAVAGGAIGGGIGLFMGGPPAVPVGVELGSAIGGFAGGSFLTKDYVNFFRKAFSLPEEQDRNQVLDVFASAISVVPGALRLGGKALKTEKSIAATLSKLPDEDKKIISALQQSVFESSSEVGTEQFATTLKNEVAKDFLDSLNAGMNTAQASSFVARKYADKIAYSKKMDEIATRFGQPMTPKEIVQSSLSPKDRPVTAARPGDVINSLNQKYRSEWATSRKLIENNKDLLDKINLNAYIEDLKTLANSADFRKEYGAKLNNIIASIENSKSIEDVVRSKAIAPEDLGKLVIVDAQTGKQMNLVDTLNNAVQFDIPEYQMGMKIPSRGPRPQLGGGVEITKEKLPLEILSPATSQPGFQIGPSLLGRRGVEDTLRATPPMSTPTDFFPAVTQQRTRLTGQPELFAEAVGRTPKVDIPEGKFIRQEEQMALSLNQKMERQKLATLDTVINLRMELDKALKDFPNLKPKEAAVADAVNRLRTIEDAAIDGMMASSDQTVKNIGMQAKNTKGALASQLFEEELIGNISRKDAIGFANILDASDPERIGAISRVLSPYPEAKNKIASSYLDKKLSEIGTGTITNLEESGVEKLVNLASGKTEEGKKFLANIEILTGDKTIQKDLFEAATLLKRATKIPNPVVKNKISGEAMVGLASKLSRLSLNPVTWINLIGPDNPTYAQKIVNQMFKNNREAFLDAAISTPESVLQTVVSLEDLFGRGAKPMTALIIDRATRQGVLTGAALSVLQPGATSTPAPMQ